MEQKEIDYYKEQVYDAVEYASLLRIVSKLNLPIYTVNSVDADGNKREMGKVMLGEKHNTFINYCYPIDKPALAAKMDFDAITRFIIGSIDFMRKEPQRDYDMEVCFLNGETTVPVKRTN